MERPFSYLFLILVLTLFGTGYSLAQKSQGLPGKKEKVRTEKSKQKTESNKLKKNNISKKPGKVNDKYNGLMEAEANEVNGSCHAIASGSLSGRQFKGCSIGEVKLRTPVTVKVSVKVNAEGRVVEAKTVGGPRELYSICEGWARTSRWSAKEGAPTAIGSITFTVTPRQK